MKSRIEEYREILVLVEKLISRSKQLERDHAEKIAAVHPRYKKSAKNLVHYWAIRQEDIRALQNKLKKIGLSRLGKAEAHILASMQTTYSIVKSLVSQQQISIPRSEVSIAEGEKLLSKNTKALLGKKTKGRNVRIMVTQPEQSAELGELSRKMMAAGMNVARINCAHDSPREWNQMIENIRKASVLAEVDCRICMDLGGPKVRTGHINAGPRVKKLRPLKDEFGKVIKPLEFRIVPYSLYNEKSAEMVPVNDEFFKAIAPDTILYVVDTRGKSRKITVAHVDGNSAVAIINKTTYIETGTKISFTKGQHYFEGEIATLPAKEGSIKLYKDDILHLHKKPISGKNGVRDGSGKLIAPPVISFTLPEIFDDLRKGERVLFDDGKIEGILEELAGDYYKVKILNAGLRGSQLKADKGINFPDSNLQISGLTLKDREDLKFVVQKADIVNFSFVNTVADVEDLYAELMGCENSRAPGVILKIETLKGYKNLFEILLKAMQHFPVGVMIARGDLAIECGWENMARIQEEILSLCNAAHIPVIWATQVLENMAKTGLPSRSEITDAATAQRAECVMLNKGPNILEAIRLLDIILKNMKDYQEKKATMLPAFN